MGSRDTVFLAAHSFLCASLLSKMADNSAGQPRRREGVISNPPCLFFMSKINEKASSNLEIIPASLPVYGAFLCLGKEISMKGWPNES